jgi:UDP-N-acetylmuramate dehydrogenase
VYIGSQMQVQENIPLAPLTTFQVGGLARYFVEASSEEDVREGVEFGRARNLPLFVMGGGSNLVVSDAGWPGLVLKIGLKGIAANGSHKKAAFLVAAGEDWDGFVARAVTRNGAGVECLSGIPGSVGGTPVQNVGAYGQEVSETIECVRALDLQTLRTRDMTNAECGFTYRTSIFNGSERGKYIILSVTYALIPDGAPSIRYGDLQKHFASSESPTLADVRDAVRQIRARKAMLITPGDEDCRSAGSFFKNPVLGEAEYAAFLARAAERGLELPSYRAEGALRKIPAAWLVEHSGFAKGYRQGKVGISRKHALAIVNLGGARAADILELGERIQQAVEKMWGVRLQPEPVVVG